MTLNKTTLNKTTFVRMPREACNVINIAQNGAAKKEKTINKTAMMNEEMRIVMKMRMGQ